MTIDVASANELLYLRSDGQFSKLYLAFPQPAVIFKARVNNASIGTDQIVYVAFDTVNPSYGNYTTPLPGMTLLVGESDGGCERGIARIRKASSSTKLFIGETSEVDFHDNDYLTVINEYGLWPKHKYVQEGTTHEDFMDFDVDYTTGSTGQHAALDPVPVLGPDRVLDYHGTLAAHPGNSISTQMDASLSYCLSSSGAKTYAWLCPTGTITDAAIADPTIHFHTTGTHPVSCAVTIGGKTFTGHRTIMVFDDAYKPISDFNLDSCKGDYDAGGWDFRVTMYDNADLALVRDRAQVILFARDWYGDITNLTAAGISFDAANKKILKASGLSIFTKGMTIRVTGSTSNDGEYIVVTSNDAYLVVDETLVDEGAGTITIQCLYGQKEISIGPVAGCENIIAMGWIDKEDLTYDINGGVAQFTVHGPQHWLSLIEGFISGLFHSETAPTEWNYVLDLTVDKGLWDLLHWRSTTTAVVDVVLTGDTKLVPTMESSMVGSLWDQIDGQAYDTILAKACCDRYGRLFIEQSGQHIPLADRTGAAFTPIMTIEAYDRTGEITLERVSTEPISLVDLSGVWYDGVTGYALRALANGHIVRRYGRIVTMEKILAEDQAHCNELASLVLAKENNLYPGIDINIAENNRLFDICPRQQAFIVTDTDMNPREVTVANNTFPRTIDLKFDDKTKSFSVLLSAEPETTATTLVTTGEIPIPTEPPSDDWLPPIGWIPWGPPEFPPFTIPEFPPWPPVPPPPPGPPLPPPDPALCLDNSPANGPFFSSWSKTYLSGDPGAPAGANIAQLWMKGSIRSATATYQTTLVFEVAYIGDALLHLNIYGIDSSGARVATGSLTYAGYYSFLGGLTSQQATATATFSLPSAIAIAGFELELTPGYSYAGVGFTVNHIHWLTASRCEPGEDSWIEPGTLGSLQMLIDESATGYVKTYFQFSASCAPQAYHADHMNFEIQAHSHSPGTGATYMRVVWNMTGSGGTPYTIARGYNADHIHDLVNGEWKLLSASGLLSTSAKGVYIQTGWEVSSFTTYGTIELLYVGTATYYRAVSLSGVSITNICPA